MALMIGLVDRPAAQQPLPAITSVERIRKLPVDEAKQGHPVRLRAVVTYRDPVWNLTFVQDETAGVFVFGFNQGAPVETGQLIELEGATGPGEYAPVIVMSNFRVLGPGSLPKPRSIRMDELMTGREDSQWIEMTGIVRKASLEDDHPVLEISSEGRRVKVVLPGIPGAQPAAHLVDARVHLSGACGTIFNRNRQLTGIQLFVPSEQFVTVQEPPPEDPFQLPVRPIHSLFRFNPDEISGHRVRVQGVVTYQRLGQTLIVRDGTDSIYLRTPQLLSVQVGDQVDIVGFPKVNDWTPEMESCLVRCVASGPLPEPLPISVEEARSGNHDAELVVLEGRLTERSTRHGDELLLVQSDSLVFEAQLEKSKSINANANLRLGSRLQLTGICSVFDDPSGRPRSFRLYLRSPDDIVVLETPSWWTAQHTLTALAGMGLVILAAVGWGMTLRRQVARQTQIISQRLEHEAMLEQRYRALVENANDMVFTQDMEGRLTSLNRAGETLSGYPAAEALQMKITDLVAAEHVDRVRQMMSQRTANGHASICEVELVAKGGRRVPVEISARFIWDGGRAVGLEGIARDITVRKKADEVHHQTEELYRRAIAAADAVPYRRDYASQAFCFIGEGIVQITGYSASEMTPETWDSLVEEMETKGEMAGLSPQEAIRLARLGKFHRWRADYRIRTRAGGTRWIADSSIEIMGTDGRPVGSIGILQDITERKHAEIEIQKLANFPRFNPNPIMELSAEGILIYANEASQMMAHSFGKSHAAEILPRDVVELVKACLETNQSRSRIESRINERTVSWSFFPIASARVVHCYATDITERLALEEQLRQVQKIDSVGQLAAGIAHDFNNILVVITGHADLLLSEPHLRPESVSSIKEIARSAERAASLTRQLLMFSRRQIIQPRLLDLNETIRNVSKMLRRLLGESIALQCSSESVKPTIRADAGMIEQVLVNLAVNGRDAMPGGGQLTVTTKVVEIGAEYSKTNLESRPGKFVCLIVSDTGCGMDRATRARLFEPFFTTKDIGKGTGLGLATVHGIVKQHQGWIEVASRIGHGTTFKIFLPAYGAVGEPLKERGGFKAIQGGSESILVVEDELAVRKLVVAILSTYGYRVREASSGNEALELWAGHGEEIALLLTDIVMPGGISGLDLAERLKILKPQLKIVFTSGYSSDLPKDKWILRDDFTFLEKPYQPQKLAQTVRNCLDGVGEALVA